MHFKNKFSAVRAHMNNDVLPKLLRSKKINNIKSNKKIFIFLSRIYSSYFASELLFARCITSNVPCTLYIQWHVQKKNFHSSCRNWWKLNFKFLLMVRVSVSVCLCGGVCTAVSFVYVKIHTTPYTHVFTMNIGIHSPNPWYQFPLI